MKTKDDRTARIIANLEFKITFSETNIRHLLGDEVVNQELIEWHRSEIQKDKRELARLQNDCK